MVRRNSGLARPVLSIFEDMSSLWHVKEVLSLADLYNTWLNCDDVIDHDLNTAKYILDDGLRNISAGTVITTDGEVVRFACKHSVFFVCKCDCY